MHKERVLTTYAGNSSDYVSTGIPGAKEFIVSREGSPDGVKLIDSPVASYSISVVAGLPLFRTHDSQTDYEAFSHDLREIMPSQFPYDNGRTHICVGAFARNNPGSEGSSSYEPEGRKKDFYKDHLDVFRNVDFSPFSLRVESLQPNGIMLLKPEGNPEQIFEARKQISQGLLDKRAEKSDFNFDEKEGQPKIDSGIIHSVFLRFADREQLRSKWETYTSYLAQANDRITSGELFADPIVVDELAFIEPRVTPGSTIRDWYNDVVVERRNFTDNPSANRIKTLDEVVSIATNAKTNGKKVVTTNGSYDITHAGHCNLIEKAKDLGDMLVVLLNSDESIKKNKGASRPKISEDLRAKKMAGIRGVDYVVIFPQDKPLNYLARIKPDVQVKGSSYDERKVAEERRLVQSWGGEMVTFNQEDEISTSSIIESIRER